jgi:hypothetical protein
MIQILQLEYLNASFIFIRVRPSLLKVGIFQPLQMKALIQVHLGSHLLDQAIDPVTNQNTCKVLISPNH